MNNFLSIVWYRVLPPDYGGQKGIAHFNNELGKKISLTCLCSRNNEPVKGLSYRILNNLPLSRFQFWNPYVRKRIITLVKERLFTHIIIEHPYHAWLGQHKQKQGFRFIVHAHNIEHLRMKARGKPWWQLIKRTEQKAFALADHILFKTDTDKDTAIRVFNIDPAKCIIVPYGIEEDKQPPADPAIKKKIKEKYGIDGDEKILLFAGTLDYEPNAAAIESILTHIVPLLQKKGFHFRLIICGQLPASRIAELNAIPSIISAGFVPSLRDYLQAADIFINPVDHGSGIQTKNIEAIANGCNVVSTRFAAAGLPTYLVGEKLFISPGDEWESFADTIIKASSPDRPVPPQFYTDYHWQNIITRLLDAVATDR